MATIFAASEIIQFAIRIEENGEVFYRQMTKQIKVEKVKELFSYLADEEVRHKQIFQEMVSQVEDYQPPESYPGEYFLYLRSYANEHVFTKEKTGLLVAKQIKSPQEAVNFAIDIELDSILYYLEAKNLVPESQKSVIDKVIDEERKHYLELSKVRKTL